MQLGVDQGLLAPGATTEVAFAVDPSQIVGNSMFFTIQVSEPGFETGVMVKVTKTALNPNLPIGPEDLIEF